MYYYVVDKKTGKAVDFNFKPVNLNAIVTFKMTAIDTNMPVVWQQMM